MCVDNVLAKLPQLITVAMVDWMLSDNKHVSDSQMWGRRHGLSTLIAFGVVLS